MIRHGCLFEQTEGANVVALLEQDLSGGRQSGPLPVVKTRFTVPFEKEHAFLAVLRHTDQRPCQFHFGGRSDPDAVPGAFENCRIGFCNAIVLGDFRLPFWVDELHRNLLACLPITIEPLFEGLVARVFFSSENGDGYLARESPQHAMRLRGKGEVLVLRQIQTNGMAGSKKVDDRENADEEEDHQQTVCAHPRRTTGGEGFQAAEMDDKKEDEAEERRSFQEGDQPEFLRGEAIDDRSGHGQSQSDQAKRNRLEIHFHRAESTTR